MIRRNFYRIFFSFLSLLLRSQEGLIRMLDTILGCFLLVVVGNVLRYKFTFMNSSRIKYLKDSGTLFFAAKFSTNFSVMWVTFRCASQRVGWHNGRKLTLSWGWQQMDFSIHRNQRPLPGGVPLGEHRQEKWKIWWTTLKRTLSPGRRKHIDAN